MKTIKILSFAIFTALSITAMAATKTVTLSKINTKNCTEQLNKGIEKACLKYANSTDTLILKLKKDKYNFHPSKKNIATLFISNHDQTNPKNLGISLKGVSNIIIDGDSSEFIFHSRMLPIAIINCANITLRNISIDFQNPHISQVQIISNDTVNNTIIYRPAPWVDYTIANGQFIAKGEGWSHKPCAGIAFDGTTRHLVYNTSDIAVGTDNCTQLPDGTISAPWRNKALTPGTIVAMRNYDRPAPAIFVDNSLNTSLENVTVHYAEGMGLLAQNSTDINLEGFGVKLKGNDDPRYFTTQADATHFSGCRGTIHSVEGLYEGMMDDAINVHGTYLKILSIESPNTLTAQYMHPQSYGFKWANVGDTVAMVKSKTMDVLAQRLTVESISPVDATNEAGAKIFQVTFNQAIPQSINLSTDSYSIENLSATPQVVFADNIVRNNRARGALFSTPKKVVVDSNIFDHTSGCAILLSGDSNGWYETGSCHDVTITNNQFINALTNMFQFTNAVISIYPEIPDLKAQQTYFHSGITITGNTFNTFDTPLLYAKSVDGLIFLDNTILHNNDFAPLHWNKAPILLERVTNARLQ